MADAEVIKEALTAAELPAEELLAGSVEPEVKQNIDKAIQHLWEAYQQIGNISDKRFKDE